MTAHLQPRPDLGEPAPWAFPEATDLQLDNGLAVQLYERPGQHVVSVALSLDLPLTMEPRESEGVVGLLASVLDQGTRSHPGTTFADAVERCGGAFDASTGYSATDLFMDIPAAHLAEGLPLLAEAVQEPELSDDDVDRERDIRLAQLSQQMANSSARADIESRATLIDPQCRASRQRTGTADTLATIDGALVRAFHARHVGPTGATLVIAGQLPAETETLVRRAFEGWTHPSTPPVVHERPRPRTPGAYLIDRPGAVQADVRLGRFTIDRTDPRWPDLTLGLYALGGAFLSRLNAVLREEKGYTYGVHASTAPMRVGGTSAVSGSFRTEVVADSVATMLELLDLGDRPLTSDELDAARRFITGVQPLQYATAAGVCNGVVTLTAAGLASTFVDEVRAAYGRVSPESATEAVTRLLPPDELTLVVVGDASALAGPLGEIGLDVTVLAADQSV